MNPETELERTYHRKYSCACEIRSTGIGPSFIYCQIHHAAPELLKSCKELLMAILSLERLVPTGIESLEWVTNAKAAIAKVEGK